MELSILRHGKAEAHGTGTPDADRPLTGQGKEDIMAIALWMAALGYRYDLVATSPLRRARETAEILAGVLELDNVETWDELAAGHSVAGVMDRIANQDPASSVLIVGHEPMLSTLIGEVIGPGCGASITLSKGAVARIKNVTPEPVLAGELHSLVTPKQVTWQKKRPG